MLEKVQHGVDWGEISIKFAQAPVVTNIEELHILSIARRTSILSAHVLTDNVEQAFHDIKKDAENTTL